MREFVLLLAAVLGLGYCFSGGQDAPEHAGPVVVAKVTTCRSESCRKMRLADPGYRPHVARDDDEAAAPR